jgi:hypothetical protein
VTALSPTRDGDRAVSTTVSYALTLGITTLLITGLLFASGTFVEDKREESIRSELRVIGQQMAAEIQAGDRLARGSEARFTLSRDFPDTVSGSTYTVRVEVSGSTETYLVLRTADPPVEVEIDMVIGGTLQDTSFEGGRMQVRYDTATTDLVVTDG